MYAQSPKPAAPGATRLTPAHFVKGKGPYVCLTAYSAPIARLVDPHADLILVGDSVGMVLYGFNNTLAVTVEMMIAHGAAVVRSTGRALVTVDMPYGSYETSAEQGLSNAQRIMAETGCAAVKLEGGQEMAATIALLVKHNIPVVGHVGLLPQSIEKMGGFKIQGRDDAQAAKVMGDAIAVADAGAFAMVIEGTIEPVARAITAAVAIPTIGIGASPGCDGQILVIDDILGFTAKPPRFAKKFTDVTPAVSEAIKAYADEVRSGHFPTLAHCFGTGT